MFKVFAALSALSLAAAPLAAQPADSQTAANPFALNSDITVDVSQLRCWDIVTLSEDDRAFAMVLVYGFAQGQAGATVFSPRDIQVAVVNTMMECVDKPDDLVLDVLKTHLPG
ncbi:HdeA/HdeB family chaperone [Qipengyuania flava]|uniref:HdeA/HdeB family chaperone n=1 Tax=Qipengyuania flava TaxID=192812 RepID=UPI001C639C0D|nr:HdeA/HdeB family chaperone [Qipengyuania flava]QYJ08337.1 hypothetical protein KUV82_06490 [Qipengyuania flava]